MIDPVVVSVDRVSVRVKPFWQDIPDPVVCQIDIQFALAGTKQNTTKFHTVTGALYQRYTAAVQDTILHPPTEGKYEQLKAQLIRHCTPTTKHVSNNSSNVKK